MRKRNGMKRLAALFTALTLMAGLLAGCTQVHPMDPTEPGTEKTEEPTQRRTRTDPSNEEPSGDPDADTVTVRQLAVYPEWPEYPGERASEKKREAWLAFEQARYLDEKEASVLRGVMKTYYGTLLPHLFAGEETVIVSPVNIWLAMAMLAEVTDGDTRAEVLEFLNCRDIEECREQAVNVMRACYIDDGLSVCEPANAMFLRNDSTYEPDAFMKLAEIYLASSYAGEMGTAEYDQVLRDWINDHTGHMLEEAANGLRMDRETVLTLASAIYLKTPWREEFSENRTHERTFTCEDGTEVEAEFLFSPGDSRWYVEGDRFIAAEKPMHGGMAMVFILPKEGVTAEELAADPQLAAFLAGEESGVEDHYAIVNLYVPKFDLSSSFSLVGVLKDCGVRRVFTADEADFSPLTDRDDIQVTQVEHAARVKIDEEGVEAAAFTVISMGATAVQEQPPEFDFICDRPFFFAVQGPNDIVEFAGMVMTPGE